jgi:hypothetical protein
MRALAFGPIIEPFVEIIRLEKFLQLVSQKYFDKLLGFIVLNFVKDIKNFIEIFNLRSLLSIPFSRPPDFLPVYIRFDVVSQIVLEIRQVRNFVRVKE